MAKEPDEREGQERLRKDNARKDEVIVGKCRARSRPVQHEWKARQVEKENGCQQLPVTTKVPPASEPQHGLHKEVHERKSAEMETNSWLIDPWRKLNVGLMLDDVIDDMRDHGNAYL